MDLQTDVLPLISGNKSMTKAGSIEISHPHHPSAVVEITEGGEIISRCGTSVTEVKPYKVRGLTMKAEKVAKYATLFADKLFTTQVYDVFHMMEGENAIFVTAGGLGDNVRIGEEELLAGQYRLIKTDQGYHLLVYGERVGHSYVSASDDGQRRDAPGHSGYSVELLAKYRLPDTQIIRKLAETINN